VLLSHGPVARVFAFPSISQGDMDGEAQSPRLCEQ
jgi:hypothetical protein